MPAVVLAPNGQQVRWPAHILRARRLAVGLAVGIRCPLSCACAPFWLGVGLCSGTPKSITSHVYHEGVAQRAHNLSPVPFGAAKSDERSSYHCSDCASQSQRGW